jgi:hypothetical protein
MDADLSPPAVSPEQPEASGPEMTGPAAPPGSVKDLIRIQFLVLTSLLALLVPSPFVLGQGPLPRFHVAAVALHLAFVGWLAAAGHARAALAIVPAVLLTPWIAWGLRVGAEISPLVSGPLAFALLMVGGFAWARRAP